MDNIVREDIINIINSNVDWERFRNKTVLVTGANGMLPSYMVLTLLSLKEYKNIYVRVLALVRNRNKAERVFQDVLSDQLSIIVQDVSFPIICDEPIDFIIHAASQASPKYYGIDPVGTLNANILGTHYLLNLAIQKKVESFLMFSSGGIYGEIPSEKMPIHEDDSGYINPINVRNCYFESKRMAENMCVSYSSQYNINTKIIRVFHTYGPNMDLNDGRAFCDFCKNIVNNENIVLHSDGSARRTFCYVSDAVAAYFLVLLNGGKGEAYNIGNQFQEISIKDLARMLVELYPEKKLSVVFDIDDRNITYGKMKSPVKRTIPDITKIMDLGWKPLVSVSDGFKRTIDSIIYRLE